MQIETSNIYGWPGIALSFGPLRIGVVPQIGGRILSCQYQDQELFFVHPLYRGETYQFLLGEDLRQRKKELGFRLWGGDKIWVAPQSEWTERIPPLELDAGAYSFQEIKNGVVMTSPVCQETGLQIQRRMAFDNVVLTLRDTFINRSSQLIRRGIWNVTQLLRPWDVYWPVGSDEVIQYKDDGLKEDAQHKISQHGDVSIISCDDQTHFKFGAKANVGCVLGVYKCLNDNQSLGLFRQFDVDTQATYAHEANLEVYNSPHYPYMEMEVHSALKDLAPQQKITFSQQWSFFLRNTSFCWASWLKEKIS